MRTRELGRVVLMRRLLTLLLLAGAMAVAGGCGGNPLASEDCIVLALGGNKLCGEDAAARCASTDGIREVSRELDEDLAALDEELSGAGADVSYDSSEIDEAQAICDDLKAQYGY